MSVIPIVTYNDEVLRKKASEIEANTKELQHLIDDMFETMYNGQGVGLAAPQIGKSIRLFVVDADAMYEDDESGLRLGKEVFINPVILEKGTDIVSFDEGCLSIPGVREPVSRPDKIKVEYLNRDFEKKIVELDGWNSRVFQHELDHLDGILFIDYLGSFRKRLIRSSLDKVNTGLMEAEYPVKPKLI